MERTALWTCSCDWGSENYVPDIWWGWCKQMQKWAF